MCHPFHGHFSGATIVFFLQFPLTSHTSKVNLITIDRALEQLFMNMTKQALLSLCHYYHGEDKCPFDNEKEREL